MGFILGPVTHWRTGIAMLYEPPLILAYPSRCPGCQVINPVDWEDGFLTARIAAGWRRAAAVVSAAVGLSLAPPIIDAAHAGKLCQGEYQTSLLYAWPAGTRFGLSMRPPSDGNSSRLEAFINGLRSAAVPIDPDSTTKVHLVFSVIPTKQEQKATGMTPGVYTDLSWRSAPRTGGSRSRNAPDPNLTGATLNLTVIVSDTAEHRQMWVATMQCVMKTNDAPALAQDVGNSLGQTLMTSVRTGR